MVRRVTSGPGATTPYDWEGMMVALIHRIHDRGLSRHAGGIGRRDAGLVRAIRQMAEDPRQPQHPAQGDASLEEAAGRRVVTMLGFGLPRQADLWPP